MQNILYVSYDIPEKYPSLEKHYVWVKLHGEVTFEKLSEAWHTYKPLAVYSTGNHPSIQLLSSLYIIRKRWIHYDTMPEHIDVNSNVFHSMLGHRFDNDNPLLTIFTTTFHSKHKIMRPLRSLLKQTYANWEWVIWDDSKDDETYKNLLELQKKDLRIRVYKAPKHSGVIGEMKRWACSMAEGAYLVEVDHDDDFHHNMLQWIVDAGKKYPDATFFYTDCAELTEETYEPATYGEFFAFGYSVHMNIWSDFHNCYLSESISPEPNSKTLSHIVGVPNHVRAWRTDFYNKIGKHNSLLAVADDYDLMLRSFIHGKWCHIRGCGYYQYRNKDGNFTFIRNELIQHNVYHIYNYYKELLPKQKPTIGVIQQWKFDEVPYEKVHYQYVPPEFEYEKTFIIIEPSYESIEKIIQDEKCKYVIYCMGKIPDIPDEWKRKVCWWNLESSQKREDKIRYVKKFLYTGGELIVI